MQEQSPRTYFERIVFLADLTSGSQTALSYARAFTHFYGAHLTLLHALSRNAMEDVMPRPHDALANVERERLQLLATEMVNRGMNVDALVKHGSPHSDVLVRAIEQLHPDLVIQGSSGIDDLRRPIVGSTAESVFRRIFVPVLTVGPNVLPFMGRPLQFNRILFVTDFGSRVRTEAVYAMSLAQEFRARVRLCHVHDSPTVSWQKDRVQRLLEEELSSFVSQDALDWCDPECNVSFGDPIPQITAIADRYHPDLIVLGAHALGPMGTRGAPGMAFKVMANATCPVLSLLGHPGKPLHPLYHDNRPDLVPFC